MCFDKRPLIAVVGPTSSGKSDLGIALAHHFNGEIINADSVRAYRCLNVATGKVPIEEQQGIRHHLFDIAGPDDNLTSFEWASLARATISVLNVADAQLEFETVEFSPAKRSEGKAKQKKLGELATASA